MATAIMTTSEQERQKEVAGNILEQLNTRVNGFPLLALIGAKKGTFAMLGGAGGLAFKIGKPTSGLKANKVLVKYTGRDTYDVEFWYLGRRAIDVSVTESETDLDVEQMISYIARRLIEGCTL